MTPEARVASAADILDDILGGAPAERALTNWARRSRFAGSRDRAAVRDIVFDALRRRRSYGWLGGDDTGRALMLGRLRAAGEATGDVFTGARHALDPLTEDEVALSTDLVDAPRAVRLDVADWTLPHFDAALGADADAVLALLRDRAPVTLRANLARTTRETLIRRLSADGFAAGPSTLANAGVVVSGETRGLARHAAFDEGLFEFQDASPQAAMERIADLIAGADVLDFCAGGGGKALAAAALGAGRVVAHDANSRRMADIPPRAKRAGVQIRIADTPRGLFDVVLVDAPCSGSGAWRRQVDAKWRLTEADLERLVATQRRIVADALVHVRHGGHLVYMTCSLFDVENADQVRVFINAHQRLKLENKRLFTPLEGGDGFFLAAMRVEEAAR
ncbi:MAG: RsmB/NOP family class I SAM-dependent RNA methyltransferase [Pseudomonadota bacterium]